MSLEWTKKKKLIEWLDEGVCTHWDLHVFELGLIMRALSYYVENHKLNPVAQECYDHIMLTQEESEISPIYPSLKNLGKIPGFKEDQ